MVSDRFYGWIRVLHLLDLDSEGVSSVLTEHPPSTCDPEDAAHYCKAVRAAGLRMGDKAAALVLERAPSIGALLDDGVAALGSTADVVQVLASLIASTGKRKDVTCEFESLVSKFLRRLASAHLEMGCDHAGKLLFLLRAVLGANAELCKYSCALQIVEIVASVSEGCKGSERIKFGKFVQIGLNAIHEHVEQAGGMRAKSSADNSNAALEIDLIGRWCCLMKAVEVLEAVGHNSDLRYSSVELNFKVWLGEIRDAVFISFISFFMKKIQGEGSRLSKNLTVIAQQ
jgi:hypothetical protein